MGDIVERLRAPRKVSAFNGAGQLIGYEAYPSEIDLEAASEIERLRSALEAERAHREKLISSMIAEAKELGIDDGSVATKFQFWRQNKLLLTFNLNDGTIETGTGFSPDEAGRKAIESMQQAYADWFKSAIEAEREECAKVALEVAAGQREGWELHPKTDGCGGSIAASNTGHHIAAAIRSRT